MTLDEQVKKITDFWLSFEFLKKFREVGDNYIKQIEEEKKHGFEQVKRTISCKGY